MRAPPAERWKGIAEKDRRPRPGSMPRGTGPELRPKHFLTGARAAYEMIVTAYAQATAQPEEFSRKEVYDGFEAAINDRETKAEKAETRFVSIDKSDVVGADVKGKTAQSRCASSRSSSR